MAASLGRGTLYLMLAQGVFLASGYLVHAGLGRILGPQQYGTFGVVIALVTIFNLLLTSGFPLAASRYTAMHPRNLGGIKKAAEKILLPAAASVFLLYFSLADTIALMLGDRSLAPYIRISAFIIPIYAIFTLHTGLLNGLREYGKQAKSQLTYNTAKVAGVFTFVLLGYSVSGALAGFALAPLAGLIIARHYLGRLPPPDPFPPRRLLSFALPLIAFTVTLQALLSLDLLLVKRLISGEEVGYYTAAANLAKIPYIMLSALGAAVFPAIAGSGSSSRITLRYIRESFRYLLLLLLPATILLSAASRHVVSLFYSPRYLAAADPLSILVAGWGLFSLFSLLTTGINATGGVRATLLLTLPLLPLALFANLVLIPEYGMRGAAISTTITGAAGLLMVTAYLVFRYRALPFRLLSTLKITAAAAIMYAAAGVISSHAAYALLGYPLLLTLYLMLLHLTGELTEKDIRLVAIKTHRGR